MHQMRFLKLTAFFIAVLCSPFFAFAQTSTVADQPDEAAIAQEKATAASKQLLDNFTNDQLKLVPDLNGLRTNSIREYLDIKTTPKNPGPNEPVQVAITSYLTDLNKATLSWALNGKVIQHGVGMTSFSFKNGPSGETTTLTISITTNTGDYIKKELSWNPVGVTIMWEADTYTPPFYKGKALMTPQARVRAIAVPDNVGTRNALSAGNLVYVWKQDDDVVSEASGYGKNSFSFFGPKPYGDTNIKVAVSSVNDAVSSEMRLNLPLAQPFILFYEDHPLLGVWQNRALSTDLNLAKKEFSVSAEPYFFSNETSETPTLLYNWSLNGKTVTNPGHDITLHNETGSGGDSALTLAMRDLKQTFQSASRSLMIHFTAEASAHPTF